MKKNALILLAAAAGGTLLLGLQQGWFSGRPGGGRYNVVLISIDSLRQDRLGLYGHRPQYAPELPVSPRLDALAAEAVVFDSAWSNSSWTLPAHVSLMTGLPDAGHQVVQDDFRLDPRRTTLAEAFHAAGYRTAGFYSGPFVGPKYGFGRGFEEYESAMDRDAFRQQVAVWNRQRAARSQPPLTEAEQEALWDRQSHHDITSPRINGFASRFLRRTAGREPFFLFLHYFDVHYDYTPAQDLAQRFDPDYRGSMTGEDWFSNPRVRAPGPGGRPVRRISERDLGHVEALYDAEIHWVDRYIGYVFDTLKEQGVWDQTLVMVVADHGDEFFEHQGIGHRSTLFTELLRVPMILRVPGETPAGARVPEVANLYDVAPTLLDYAGLPGLPEAQGGSLRALVQGGRAPAGALGRIFHYREGTPLQNIRDCWRDRRYTVIRQFLVGRQRTEDGSLAIKAAADPATHLPYVLVFDRDQDPGEHVAVPREDPRWREAVQGFCRDFSAMQRHCGPLARSVMEQRWAAVGTAAELEALGEIGYVGAPESAEDRLPAPGPFPSPCGL